MYDFDNNTIGSAITGGTAPTNASAKVEEYNNGWYRLSVTGTLASNAPTLRAVISVAASTSSIYHAGNGRDNIYVFGCQIEQQSYPTSLIITNGSTQTRAAETCNGAGTSSIFESSEGILYLEAQSTFDSSKSRRISISDGTISNRIAFEFDEALEVIG